MGKMRIKETIERECCDFRLDLRRAPAYGPDYRFCVHCGQIWKRRRILDAAGGWEDVWQKVNLKGDER
jgi:hypothetical protein